jgi:soluble lytic murein transglycosylase-like protein
MTVAEFDPWDADDSARVGMCFLGYLLRYFGRELRPSVAGYNCGRGAARLWWAGRSALPLETQGYVPKVLGGAS